MTDGINGIINDLEQKLSGYFTLLNYRYCNICIKASVLSLLPVVVEIEEEEYNLEDVADVAPEQSNPYVLKVFPKDEANLGVIGMSIAKEHPEFKQERQSINIGVETEHAPSVQGDKTDWQYILLTMPEVDEDRRDTMNDAVKALNDDCKVRMDAVMAKSKASAAQQLVGKPKEEVDEANEAIQKKYDEYAKMCEDITGSKYKEIEKGYEDYVKGQEEQSAQTESEKSENDATVAKSMKL